MVVLGRVQGVGFRAFVAREARRRRLAGIVWNRRDGAVELEAEGDRVELEAFASSVGRGSPGSRVSGVEVGWSEGPARFADFQVVTGAGR